jgi:diguanylate cyclase (GGDEF)-like protein
VASAASIWRLKDGVIGPLAASAGPVPDDVVLTELSAATGADRPAARLDRDDESWIAMVAVHGDQPMGLVAVGRIGRANAWEPETIELFAAIQPHLGIALRQAMERASLERESRTDPLTGLLNRRAFLSELATALERSRRQARGGCLLFVDLDNFKPLNDLLGHAAGDEALVKLARMMGQNTRRYDLVGRLGGDEFAIWLDDTDIAIGERRAHALIANVAEVRPVDGDPERPLGLSIGLALFDARRDDQPEQAATLVARADRAMYRSKAGGKDRITVAEPCPASAA